MGVVVDLQDKLMCKEVNNLGQTIECFVLTMLYYFLECYMEDLFFNIENFFFVPFGSLKSQNNQWKALHRIHFHRRDSASWIHVDYIS